MALWRLETARMTTAPCPTQKKAMQVQQPGSQNETETENPGTPEPGTPSPGGLIPESIRLPQPSAETSFSYGENLDRIFKPVQIAEILGVKVETVWSWCRSGKLPHLALSKRAFRIRSSDLQDFLRSVTR